MSDFLDSLVDHSLGAEPALRPLVPSRFEPMRDAPFFRAGDLTGYEESSPAPTELASVFATANAAATGPLPFERNPQRYDSPVQHHMRESVVPRNEPTSRPALQGERIPEVAGRQAGPSQSSGENNVDWLHRRLDDLTSQLHRLRGDSIPLSRPPVSGGAFSDTGKEIPALQRAPDIDRTNDSPLPLAAAVEAPCDLSEEPRMIAPTVMPTVFQQQDVASKSTSPDMESWDQRLSLLEGSNALPPQILAEQPPHRSQPVREPVSNDPPHPTADRSFSSAQFEDLLSQIDKSAMQPPPRVVTEDLSSLSRRAEAQPTINVTIGRVEVKATREQAPAPRPARPASNPAVMSLDDYLKRRAAGGIG